MELVLIVAVVIGVAWFVVPRLTGRRRAEDTYEDSALRGSGALSWLPAWMLFGAMTHGDSTETGSAGHDVDAGWGGGADSGGGDFGGGGGDLGGGGFGGD
jgi:uncharacterized membrane protein YgcG